MCPPPRVRSCFAVNTRPPPPSTSAVVRLCFTHRQPLDCCFPRRRLFSLHALSADDWAKWQIAPRALSLRGSRCQAFKRHRPQAPLQEWIPFKALAVFWLFFFLSFFLPSVTIASLRRLQQTQLISPGIWKMKRQQSPSVCCVILKINPNCELTVPREGFFVCFSEGYSKAKTVKNTWDTIWNVFSFFLIPLSRTYNIFLVGSLREVFAKWRLILEDDWPSLLCFRRSFGIFGPQTGFRKFFIYSNNPLLNWKQFAYLIRLYIL